MHKQRHNIAKYFYNKWRNYFCENDIPFIKNEECFFSMSSTKNVVYKFNFNIYNSYNYIFSKHEHKLFADIFFTEGWEEELDYALTYYANRYKTIKTNENYSDNYGEVCVHVKPFVEYVTFQHGRVIVQLNVDKLMRKEKLKQLNESRR